MGKNYIVASTMGDRDSQAVIEILAMALYNDWHNREDFADHAPWIRISHTRREHFRAMARGLVEFPTGHQDESYPPA